MALDFCLNSKSKHLCIKNRQNFSEINHQTSQGHIILQLNLPVLIKKQHLKHISYQYYRLPKS
jgi:hypothetical protein